MHCTRQAMGLGARWWGMAGREASALEDGAGSATAAACIAMQRARAVCAALYRSV